jgi:hypothetical protein
MGRPVADDTGDAIVAKVSLRQPIGNAILDSP